MPRSKVFAVFLFLLLSFVASAAPDDVTLQIKENTNNYVLSVPVSQLIMVIPKGSLARRINASGGATENPRYFYFQDKERALIISGWFESSQGYSSFRKSWGEEKESWRVRHLPLPVNEKTFTAKGWEAVAYDIPFPNGENTHIRAHWVEAGTWIDLHLSMTSESRNSAIQEQLLAVLNGIQVQRRR
jgi:hypothetical protein